MILKKQMKQIKMNEGRFSKGKMKRLNEHGITLVALVVTIIIMLILAGVVLNVALGDNGLIGKAKQAVEKYEEAQLDEEENLKNLEDNLKVLLRDAGEEVDAPHNVKWDTSKVTPTSDGKGNVIPVPKGFYYAGGDKDSGFVISDVKNDDLNNSKQGNQFVWIPCTAGEYEEAKNDVIDKNWSRNDEYDTNGKTDKGVGLAWSDDYAETDVTNINNEYNKTSAGTSEESGITAITSNWEKNQTSKAMKSTEKYSGFYIARYEAGIPSTASFYVKEDLKYDMNNRGKTNKEGLEIVKNLLPISKKGAQAWNCISQPNSKIVAENMYKNNDSVGSYLVDSQAWNRVCNVFDQILGTSNAGRTIKDSTAWGNYCNNTTTDYSKINGLWAQYGISAETGSWDTNEETYKKGKVNITPNSEYTHSDGKKYNYRIELATGICDDFKVYNVYDMAGNMWEWTTGHNISGDKMYVVPRGGSFKYEGTDRSVVRAGGNDGLTTTHFTTGFRVVLYIK